MVGRSDDVVAVAMGDTTKMIVLRGPILVIIVVLSWIVPYVWQWLGSLSIWGWGQLLAATLGVSLCLLDLGSLFQAKLRQFQVYLDTIVLDHVLSSIFDPYTGWLAVGMSTLVGNALVYTFLPTTESQRILLTQAALELPDARQAQRVLLQPGGWKYYFLPSCLQWNTELPEGLMNRDTYNKTDDKNDNDRAIGDDDDDDDDASTCSSVAQKVETDHNESRFSFNNERCQRQREDLLIRPSQDADRDVNENVQDCNNHDDNDLPSPPPPPPPPPLLYPETVLFEVVQDIVRDRWMQTWTQERQQRLHQVITNTKKGLWLSTAAYLAWRKVSLGGSSGYATRRAVNKNNLIVMLSAAGAVAMVLQQRLGRRYFDLPNLQSYLRIVMGNRRWRNVAALLVLGIIGSRRSRRSNQRPPDSLAAGRY